jgi:type I restriction enzyme S subunit
VRLAELIDFNPRTGLPKAGVVPFIDMAALPTMGRDISLVGERPASSSGSKFRNGDTLLARITPCLENGKGAKVSGLPSEGVGQGSTEFIVLRAKLKSDENFVYYLSRHPDFRSFAIQQMSGTSGRQRVSWQPLADFEIQNLDVQDRAAIGDTLSLLDDKIELNRRMNETLEGMAQAIFRDWFVDFGPTRRKAAGESDPVAIVGGLTPEPVRAAELAALFPAAFGNDGLPVGWGEEPLLDQAHWINGAAYKNMHFVPKGMGLPVVKIAELKAGVSDQTKFTNTDLGQKYRIKDGELTFSWSGNPDTSIDAFIWTGGEAWLNQHIFAVRENGKMDLPTLHTMLKWLMPQFAELARNKQTTGLGHVTKDDMKRLLVAKAPHPVASAFSTFVGPIFQRIVATLYENRTLAETRDYLLPRLMSGAVRVAPKVEAA